MRINDYFVEGGIVVVRLLLVGLVCFALVEILFMGYGRYRQTAMAAARGLDGPDIELLERQNQAYERVIHATAPGIVYIRTEHIVKAEQSPTFMDPSLRQFFGGGAPQIPQDQKQHALGTGVLFDPSGYIVTNNHVIAHASTVEVVLTDKRMFKAKVIGGDPDTDIAVVKINATGLPTVPLGDSSSLHVGDTVMAFGNPFGLNFTVTNIEAVQDFIQTDAAINPGNSGGALVDVKGQIVGINTAILSGNQGPRGEGGFMGIGFAWSRAT
jgi:S1-C subfamily serine protease